MTVKDLHELFDHLTMFDFEYETGCEQVCFNDGRFLRKYYDYKIIGKINIIKDRLVFKCRIEK